MQLFLDCDGVLADFDARAIEVLGMNPRDFEEKKGTAEFWRIIEKTPDFFYSLQPMAGAFDLVDAVAHLKPIILTGVPQGSWAIGQKLRWGQKYFPELKMWTCRSKDKIKLANPGDIIVDDWLKHRQKWIDGGGIWVTHTSAWDSIRQLKELGVI
jgi:hypothetical protein